MTAQNLFKALGGHSWFPDADSVGAPEGALLRADNVVPDEAGAMSVRLGTGSVYSGLFHQRAHSLYSAEIDGTIRRLMCVDNNLYLNGVDQSVVFDGSGDVSFADDSYQVFAARGTVKKKFDGSALRNWSIAAPVAKPTLTATNAVFFTVATFQNTESPAFVVNEGTGSFTTGFDSTANGAIRLAPNPTTGRASASKKFASDQNMLNISGSIGGDTDLFDMYTFLEDPRRVDKVTVMFGLNTGDDPFRDDYYYFDFRIREDGEVDVKDETANTSIAYSAAAIKTATALTISDVTQVRTPADVSRVLKRLQRFSGPRARARHDASEASPAWTHFSVMRGQFKRVGGTQGRDWKTVRGFKVVYTVVPGSTAVAQFDSAVIQGGGARSLTGKYRVCYRFVRDTGNYVEKSPVSPLSDEIVLTQQALRVTIPAEAVNAADPQTNQIWIYLFGGFLDTFYRFAVTSSNPSTSTLALEETDPSGDGSIDAADSMRHAAYELAIASFTIDPTVSVDVLKGEMDVLVENIALEPGAVGAPDNIVAVAGPWAGRMFAITEEGYVYPSASDSPSNFSLYHVLDFRPWGVPKWAVRTNGGILVGMTKDIVRIGGSGDESADRSAVDMFPEPLGVGNPPVDESYYTDGNSVVYRAADGLMQVSGVTTTAVPETQVSLLWRGKTRHGVEPLNTVSGRFRLAVDNHILYMVAPESSDVDSNVVWRFMSGRWSRTVYPHKILSLFREPDGKMIAGTDNGRVLELESGTQDLGLGIPVSILTAVEDGGSPLSRKDPFDLQLLCNTGGTSGVVEVLLDGSITASLSQSFQSSGLGVARVDVSSLAPFFRAQLRISGTFGFGFVLNNFNLSYRQRPQQMMALDTGAILPQDNGDLTWIQEVECDCISPVNLELVPYKDDVAQSPLTIAVTPNRRSMYRRVIPRGLKARRPRLLIRTTNPSGTGNIGFEPYSVRVRTRGSGNDRSEHKWVQVWPVGQHA